MNDDLLKNYFEPSISSVPAIMILYILYNYFSTLLQLRTSPDKKCAYDNIKKLVITSTFYQEEF